MSNPLRFRSPELVVGILGYVYEADEPIPWEELVAVFSSENRPWKTVENTIYDLVAFGALHRIGKPSDRRRGDTRALKATPLGRSWLERELLPLPTDPGGDEQGDEDLEALELADRIAEELAGDLDL